MQTTRLAANRRKQSAPASIPALTEPIAGNAVALSCAIGLAAIVVVLYWRVFSYQFINLDDDTYVWLNEHVKQGLTLAGVRWAFSDVANGNWHPLTWISHMLDVQWFGLDAGGHHLVSVFWHAVNSAVLLVTLCRMTGRVWRSSFVAALFALHPLRVESIAWVSERKDVLSAFFYLCLLLAYSWYVREPQSWRRYATVTALLCLGLMTKASVVTAPFLLLLLDYWPLSRKERLVVLLREKIPFFALAAGVSVVTYSVQEHVGAMTAIRNLQLSERLANVFVSYLRYLGKIFWPHPLAVLYPYQRDLPMPLIAAACLLLAAITTVVLLLGRRFRYLPVGWFWFLGTMVPMIGLVQVGWQAYADRYSYIPSIGILIAVVWMTADALEHRPWGRKAAIAAAATILPALAAATFAQLPYWHDDLRLFQHAVETSSENPMAQYHLGQDLAQMGRNDEAIPHLAEVVRLEPRFYAGYYALGTAMAGAGDGRAALSDFSTAIKLKPDFAQAYYARGLTLLDAGDARSAEADFRTALQYGLDTGYSADAHNALGLILAERNDLAAAAGQFEDAVRLRPEMVAAQQNLALALMRQGRVDEALSHLHEAISATHGDATLRKMFDDFKALGPVR